MGEKSLATATPSMQCKRRAGDVDKEGGNEGDVRAGKRAAVDVRQELPGG